MLEEKYGKDVPRTIQNNCLNLIYLLSGEYETLKQISDNAGSRLIWSKEKQQFESVPVLSIDILKKFSLGEGLILRQRKNPILTRFTAYDKMVFYDKKKISFTREDQDPPTLKFYDLNLAIMKKDYINKYSIEEIIEQDDSSRDLTKIYKPNC